MNSRVAYRFVIPLIAAAAVIAAAGSLRAQVVNPPAPLASNAPVTPSPSPGASASPQSSASPAPSAQVSGAPPPAPAATTTPTPTPPPIVVTPAAAQVPVGLTQTLQLQAVLGAFTVTVANANIVSVTSDQDARSITLTGTAPGTTTLTITDTRGISATVPVRVAYNAGTIGDGTTIQITGDPADARFVVQEALAAAYALAQPRVGAQIVTSADEVTYDKPLAQDDVTTVGVPVLIQGNGYFSVQGTTHVRVVNVAAPKIVPDRLMVSDFPERLDSNGILFTTDLKRDVPTRLLFFHYNPPGSMDRRVVLRAENLSPEPASVQFIDGVGGPDANEMQVGHDSTRRFLTRLVQNEGRIIVIPGAGTLNLVEQDLPARAVVQNLLQLRVLNGGTVHLTLFAQDASHSPDEQLANSGLLQGDHPHARGVYTIPEFHYSRLWSVTDPYLELPIGQIPLPNLIQGEALAGDYGVLQSFVIRVENPMPSPQHIAIYEDPRGGRATGTYLIDGVLIQSHQVPAFSHYKIRQYVVPARGFVRVTIATIPEGGSSYPLRLVFAPDDGSVAPGAPGSPVY